MKSMTLGWPTRAIRAFPLAIQALAVTMIGGLASGISFVATIAMLRVLPAATAGQVSLLTSQIATLAVLCSLGQTTGVVRLFSKQPPHTMQWPCLYQRLLRHVALASLAGTIACSLLYHYDLMIGGVLLIAVLGATWIDPLAGLVRSTGAYTRATLLYRGPYFVFAAATLLLYGLGRLALTPLLIALTLSFVVCVAPLLIVLPKQIGAGSGSCDPHVRRDWSWLWLYDVSSVLLMNLDVLLLGWLLPASSIAAYISVMTFGRIYEVVAMSLSFILIPLLAGKTSDRLHWLWLICGALVVVSGALLAWGPQLIGALYAGRYDESAALFRWMIGIGLLKTGGVLLASAIQARADVRQLRRFVGWNWALLGVALLIGPLVIHEALLGGAAAMMAALWLGRLILSAVEVRHLRGTA